MTATHINKYSLLAGAVLFCVISIAKANDGLNSVSIPMLDNAQIFADFTSDMPAVLNYYTSATEEQIIDFYQQNFGESTSQERKRGHLMLTYQQGSQSMRVIISQQNKKRQVDVIINKTK